MNKTFALSLIILLIFLTSCSIQPSGHPSIPASKEENISSASSSEDRIPAPSESDDETLVIYAECFLPHIAPIIEQHMDGIKISYIHQNISDYQYINQNLVSRLLSGDDCFDVYSLSSTSGNARTILEKGYYVDLSIYPEINSVFSNIFPTIVESSTFEGTIFGMPIHIGTRGHLEEPKTNMQKANWSTDQIQTFDDLNQLDAAWKQAEYDHEAVALQMPNLVWQVLFRYIYAQIESHNEINLDSDTFRELLDNIRALYQSDLVAKDFRVELSPRYALISAQYIDESTESILPMPQLNGQNDKNLLYCNWMVLNPYSQNTAASLKLLNTLAEFHKLSDSPNIIYNNPAYYQDCTLDLPFDTTKKVSKEFLYDLDLFYKQHQLVFSLPCEKELFWIFHGYIQGDIPIDQAIRESQQILDLVIREQQTAN